MSVQTQVSLEAKRVEVEERQEHSVVPVGNAVAVLRTFLVFLDLPWHYEFRVSEMPLIPEETVIEFNLSLRDPQTGHTRLMEGPYKVCRRKLAYRTDKPSLLGLTQYLELSQVVA